jgi:micrococcal nuclease
MPFHRLPSLGSLVLLALLVIVLVSGGDEDEPAPERDRPRAERPDRERSGRNPESVPAPADPGGGRRGSDQRPEPGLVAPVVDVVDGDTIEVAIRGEVEDVRYIGVDTPETVAPGEPVGCFGPQSSAANERLVAGERVRLVFDAERRDYYGRLLAYVYVEPDGRFVNAALLRRGLARTLTIAPNDSLADRFDRIEQAAANAGRGLWGAC